MTVDAVVKITGTIEVPAEDMKEAYSLALEYVENDFWDSLDTNISQPDFTVFKVECFEGYVGGCEPVVKEEDDFPESPVSFLELS